MTINRSYLQLIVLAAILLSGASVVHAESPRRGPARAIPEEWYFSDQFKVRRLEGATAPELNVEVWIGKPQKLTDLLGNIVVLDFWAEWCAPCIYALSIDARIARDYGDRGVTLIGVHDPMRGRPSWEKAQGIAKDREVRYAVGLDSSDKKDNTHSRYKIEAWPTYVVVDRQGIVRAAGLRPECVEDVVDKLLKEPDFARNANKNAFPAEIYLGGSSQPCVISGTEGTVVPSLTIAEWLGNPQDPSLSIGGVTVVHFWSPTHLISIDALDSLRKIEPDLVKRGARLIAVCDSRAEWAQVKSKADEGSWTTAIAHDAPSASGDSTQSAAIAPAGATRAAFGVKCLPVTFVVDGTAVIRAAGVKVDKVVEVVDAIGAGQEGGQTSTAMPK